MPQSQDTGHTGAVEKVFQAETVATADELFAVVSDLTTFPDWIELVHRVEPISNDGTASGVRPQWWVTLRAQIGPFARSKRLRMARTVHQPPGPDQVGQVRFDRAENDGRDHAPWTMEVTVAPVDDGAHRSRADCRLHYGGSLWTGLLDGQLDATARRSTRDLRAIAAARTS